MTRDELREKLAAQEHNRWSRWELYREQVCSAENVEMWRRKRKQQYSDLTEQEKESDRAEADKTLQLVWPLIEDSKVGMDAAIDALTIALDRLKVVQP